MGQTVVKGEQATPVDAGGETIEWNWYNTWVLLAASGIYRIFVAADCSNGRLDWSYRVSANDVYIGSANYLYRAKQLCEDHKAKLEGTKPKEPEPEPEPEYKWVTREDSHAPCWCLFVRGKEVGAVDYCPSHTAPFRASITGTFKEWGDFTLRAAKESIEKYLRIKTK